MAIDYIDFIKTTTSKLDGVKDEYPQSFIHVHDEKDGDVVNDALYIGKCRVTDNFNIGNMSEDVHTQKVGGLEPTTIGELKNKSMSEIMMNILCPLNPPSISINPSVSVSYSGIKLIEVGSLLPNENQITTSYNKGKWNDGTDYWGDCDVTITMSPDEWGNETEDGIYVITATGIFGEGDVPKDSHGNLCDDKKQPGGTKTSSIDIVSVYPIYINDSNITVMSKKIIDYNKEQTLYVDIPAEIDGTLNKFQIWMPYVFNKFEVKQFNSISGKYDIDIDMELIDGETSKYIRTNDLSSTKGPSKYEIKLKK